MGEAVMKTVKSPITGNEYRIRQIPTKIGLRIIGKPESEAMEMILKACVVEMNGEKIKDIDEIPFVDALWLMNEIMRESGLDEVLKLTGELPKNQ